MNELADSESTPSATELPSSALDSEKWVAEKAFRERELDQKERELRRLEDELRFRMEEARRSRWSSPLVLAVLAAGVAALGNAGVVWLNAIDQRRLEDARAAATQKTLELNNTTQLVVEGFKAEAARLLGRVDGYRKI